MNIFDVVIVQPVFNLLLGIYAVIGDFGVAIILFTLLVKFAMWPLVKRQLHQTKLMRKIQPELAEIKKNCKGNRQLESLQMMDLYKRNNIKPFRSMLTLLIQLPIILTLYSVVRSVLTDGASVAEKAYGFIKNFDRVQELINNFDQFSPKLFGIVDMRVSAWPIVGWSSVVILVLVIGSCVMQYVVSRQQMPQGKSRRKFKDIMKEAADGKEADQSEINGIVSGQMGKMMPIMMFLIFIGLPGALALYYLTSNAVQALQQKIVLAKSENEMEELADKKVLKELRDVSKIREAEVVKTKTKENITRIKASDKKRRKK